MNAMQKAYFFRVLTAGVIVGFLYAAFYWAVPWLSCFGIQLLFIVGAFVYGLYYFR